MSAVEQAVSASLATIAWATWTFAMQERKGGVGVVHRWTRAAGLLLAVALASCRYQPNTVPLHGRTTDVAALSGEWSGEYASAQSGRSGSIILTIQPGRDTAYGDVVMIPASGARLLATDATERTYVHHGNAPEVLRIAFVRIVGGVVEGAIEPYVAPDCRCTVRTVFQGTLSGDRIEGRYTTRGEFGVRQEGSWRAERKTTSPEPGTVASRASTRP